MVELNDETRWILGRPNFACAGVAAKLRERGHEIAHRSEDEQATVLHWMLTLYEQHGAAWRERATEYLVDALYAQAPNAQGNRTCAASCASSG